MLLLSSTVHPTCLYDSLLYDSTASTRPHCCSRVSRSKMVSMAEGQATSA